MNPEFKEMINRFIGEQENVILNQIASFNTAKLIEVYHVKHPSDFLYGRLFGIIAGYSAALYGQFHAEPYTAEASNEVEDMVRDRCREVKQKIDDADFQ